MRSGGRGWWAAIVLALAPHAADAPAAEPPAERLNVLFVSVDDLRPELGSYGAPTVTPRIDRLAAEGLRFNRAYASAAACAASRVSMVTGVYPHTTRVYLMKPPLAQANPALVTMPQLFREAGYEAVEIGKFMHVDEDAPNAWSRERWMPAWDPPEYLVPENRHMTGIRKVPRGPVGEGADVADGDYLDGKLARRAVQELRRLHDRPFFLAVGFVRPHLPFNCPKRYWDLYDPAEIAVPEAPDAEAVPPLEWHGNYEPAFYSDGGMIDSATGARMIHGYRACVSYIDAQVGLILDELDRLALADRTVVVLWGDHGWHLGEHGIWGKNTAFEVALRVPLILRVPGFPAGHASQALVESVDILPTLCELVGIPIPEQVQGRSFEPLLRSPDRPWKQAAFGWRQRPVRAGQTVRTPRYRFVRWITRDGFATTVHATELYDHDSDPGETVNLADDPRRVQTVRRMHALIDAWLRLKPTGLLGGDADPNARAPDRTSVAYSSR
ncbi:MAG: sulfatase [Myxococcota bacterium]